jgi:hypothetical protein
MADGSASAVLIADRDQRANKKAVKTDTEYGAFGDMITI